MLLCEGKGFFGMFFDERWRGVPRKAIVSLDLGQSTARDAGFWDTLAICDFCTPISDLGLDK